MDNLDIQAVAASLILVNGCSGSGKGTATTELKKEYEANGFRVFSMSSGEAFRKAAETNPQLAEDLHNGKVADTLEQIIPTLQNQYLVFLNNWQESNGKAVFVLDGFLRRAGDMSNNIPSQLVQLATAFADTTGGVSHEVMTEYLQTISKHLVVSIRREDAELQLKRRPISTIEGIIKDISKESEAYGVAQKLLEVLKYSPQTEEEIRSMTDEIREDVNILSKGTGKKDIVRPDDIAAIPHRLDAFFHHNSDGYLPNFAAESLIQLGYTFNIKNGTLTVPPDKPNLVVVENGASLGVNFEDFKGKCREVAQFFILNTETTREIRPQTPEGYNGPSRER